MVGLTTWILLDINYTDDKIKCPPGGKHDFKAEIWTHCEIGSHPTYLHPFILVRIIRLHEDIMKSITKQYKLKGKKKRR